MSYWHKVAYKNPFCYKFWERRYRLWKERRQGVDFSIIVDPEDVGLNPQDAQRSFPSAGKYLRKALKNLPISGKDTIIDIGCGKGSAMRVLMDFPFSRVDGVEIAEEIAAVARANFSKLGIPASRCTVFTGDACGFKELNAYNYIYFYNPFSPRIMTQCVENICCSLEQSPRAMTIIYNHASCHDAVIANRVFHKVGEYPSEFGNKIFVYSNRG